MSGGTELCGSCKLGLKLNISCLNDAIVVHGTPALPYYAGECAVKALGLDVDVFSSDGKPVPPGESGELVCIKPFPNMPVCFLNDPGKKRYFESYFSVIPRQY